MTSFVIVNNCSDAALTDAVLAAIAAAIDVQVNRDVGTWWGGDYRVRAATADNPPAPGEIVALVVDDLPDAPGAVAFHNWEGVAQIYAARNMCQGLVGGPWSLSQALSHEIVETIGDLGCNLWADDGTGSEWAHELCDPVEQGSYNVNDIAVSDFVLPSYFDAGGTGPYSFAQAQLGDGPAMPFGIASGGYAIKRTAGSGESQVQAFEGPTVSLTLSVPFGMRAAKKRHWSSRTFRRGARVS